MELIRTGERRDNRRLFLRAPVQSVAREHGPAGAAQSLTLPNGIARFPSRPDSDALNETIPLFYVGQNREGFWVVRDSSRRSGGVFFFKASARHFARTKSARAGCALMFLNERLELDCPNEGGRIAGLISAILNVARRRAPGLVAFASLLITEWRKFMRQLSQAAAGERLHRAALERELSRNQYRLNSRNDDDLPIASD
jgi:hypothetical protein